MRQIDWSNPVNWDHPLNQGLTAWWLNVPHWQGGTQFRDLLKLNNGILNGPEWSRIHHPGGLGSVDFATEGDTLSANDMSIGTTELTVSAWIYTRTGGIGNNFGRVCGKGDSNPMLIQVTDSGGSPDKVSFWINGDDLVLTNILTYNVWLHFLGRWRSAETNGRQIWLDGINIVSDTFTASMTQNTDPIEIGNRGNGQRTFDGFIDDVRIWDRALSSAEIVGLYEDSLRGYPATLRRLRRRGFLEPAAAGAANPKGPLGMPLCGALGGPV